MYNLPDSSTQKEELSLIGLVWVQAYFFFLNFLFWKIPNLQIYGKNITVKIYLIFTQIHQLLTLSHMLAFSRPPSSLSDPQNHYIAIMIKFYSQILQQVSKSTTIILKKVNIATRIFSNLQLIFNFFNLPNNVLLIFFPSCDPESNERTGIVLSWYISITSKSLK